MCLDPDMLQIVGLNYAIDDGPSKSGWSGESNPDLSETDLLETFWTLVKKTDQIVGFNILGLDLPALLTRSAILEWRRRAVLPIGISNHGRTK